MIQPEFHDATARVVVFDSGLGGLTVLQAIRQTLPGLDYVYAADTAGFPYGTQSDAQLIERLGIVLPPLVRHCRADLLVVACNTASSIALAAIRGWLDIPVVGVVPAIKPAAAITTSGVIGVLATPATVNHRYTDQLVAGFADHCEVIRVGSAELVELAEARLHGATPGAARLQAILAPFHTHPRGDELDTMVLACTHFPLLATELAAAFGRPLHWIDSAQAIANRVAQLLASRQAGSPAGGVTALFTAAALPPAQPLGAFGITRLEHFAPALSR